MINFLIVIDDLKKYFRLISTFHWHYKRGSSVVKSLVCCLFLVVHVAVFTELTYITLVKLYTMSQKMSLCLR